MKLADKIRFYKSKRIRIIKAIVLFFFLIVFMLISMVAVFVIYDSMPTLINHFSLKILVTFILIHLPLLSPILLCFYLVIGIRKEFILEDNSIVEVENNQIHIFEYKMYIRKPHTVLKEITIPFDDVKNVQLKTAFLGDKILKLEFNRAKYDQYHRAIHKVINLISDKDKEVLKNIINVKP